MSNGVSTPGLEWFATLGVGGVLAGFMFVFYRKDVRQYTTLWEAQANRIEALVNTVLGVVRENTASNAKLITLIENMQRNVLRIEDVNGIVDRRISDNK